MKPMKPVKPITLRSCPPNSLELIRAVNKLLAPHQLALNMRVDGEPLMCTVKLVHECKPRKKTKGP